MPVRNKLGSILEDKDITQSDLVKRLEQLENKTVTRATISNIVREKYHPSLELAFQFGDRAVILFLDPCPEGRDFPHQSLEKIQKPGRRAAQAFQQETHLIHSRLHSGSTL
jgi:DNA-binding XRE family transcriptional regulator